MPLLTLADALLDNASKFLGCYEDMKYNPKTKKFEGTNRSACIDEIQSMFDPKRVDKGDAYCAKFVSNILNLTFPFFLKLPPAIGDSNTHQLYQKAKKQNIPILDYPVRGAVFFYARSLTTGHVGFVEHIVKEGNKIVGFSTIEGNATKQVNGKTKEGVVQISRKMGEKDYIFIDYPALSDLRIPTARTVLDITLLTAGCIGAYYTYKRFGHDAKLVVKKKLKELK
jgi:hypothetical protein